VLVLESTFNSTLARGEAVPGLRAPDPGTAPNITGAWSISGVPNGKYAVLAAFENDGNVRDPDPGIAGTQVAHITVTGGSANASPQFKVTGAVSMVGPGAGDTPEQVTGTPTFTWSAYPATNHYVVDVFNAQGVNIWQAPSVTGSGTVSTVYAGPALTPGAFYQWRATAIDVHSNPISYTEDLRGVWQVQ
jgi:hypothetical protein